MKAKPKQYAVVLYDLVKDAEESQIQPILKQFVDVLIKNNQLSQIEKVINYFYQLWNKEKNIAEAEIISAHKLNDELVDMIKEYLNKKVEDKKVEIETKINKSLKGGFMIRYDDMIIDSTIKNRIRQLKNNLI